MSLLPDYRVPRPQPGNVKWDEIECWRNDLLPTFTNAIHLASGSVAHWRMIDAQYDAEYNVTELKYASPENDKFKAEMTYSGVILTQVRISYKRVPVPGIFEYTVPAIITLTWVGDDLQSYTWSEI